MMVERGYVSVFGSLLTYHNLNETAILFRGSVASDPESEFLDFSSGLKQHKNGVTVEALALLAKDPSIGTPKE